MANYFNRITNGSLYFDDQLVQKLNNEYLAPAAPDAAVIAIEDTEKAHPKEVKVNAIKAHITTEDMARTLIGLMSKAEENFNFPGSTDLDRKLTAANLVLNNVYSAMYSGLYDAQEAKESLLESGYPKGFDNYLELNLKRLENLIKLRKEETDVIKDNYIKNLETVLNNKFGPSVINQLKRFDNLVGEHIDDRKILNLYSIHEEENGASATLSIFKTGDDKEFIQGVNNIIDAGFNKYKILTRENLPAIGIKFFINADKELNG